jgi:hypothetical protein
VRRGRALIAAGIAAATVGCATATTGTRQLVTIASDPPGASARIEPGGIVVTTPAEIELARKFDYEITLTLAGHQPASARITRGRNPAALGNLPLGGFAGIAVDAATGAAYELWPDPVFVKLAPEGGASADPRSSAALEGSHTVVFFNHSKPTRRLTIDGGPACKLRRNEFVVREVQAGKHELEIEHWDLVWLSKTREIVIDGSFSHVALVLDVTSDEYVTAHGFPTPRKRDFREVCK